MSTTSHPVSSAAVHLAWRVEHNGTLAFVSHLPGQGGKDWGYTGTSEQARLLTAAQLRRFQRNCTAVGRTAGSITNPEQGN